MVLVRRVGTEYGDTHLLPDTGVESHHHSVHERDIELFGEVEDALMNPGQDRMRAMTMMMRD